MHYYGIDWACKAVIAAAIIALPKHRVLATWLFMAANVFSIAVAVICCPMIWGTIIGDVGFVGLHAWNLWKWRANAPKFHRGDTVHIVGRLHRGRVGLVRKHLGRWVEGDHRYSVKLRDPATGDVVRYWYIEKELQLRSAA